MLVSLQSRGETMFRCSCFKILFLVPGTFLAPFNIISDYRNKHVIKLELYGYTEIKLVLLNNFLIKKNS